MVTTIQETLSCLNKYLTDLTTLKDIPKPFFLKKEYNILGIFKDAAE